MTKLASVGGPTHRAGLILFENPDRPADSGGRWIVRTRDQAFDGGVRISGDGQLAFDQSLSLTLTGRATQYADNQFQIASNRTLTLTGPGTLRLSGDLGFAPGSRINANNVVVVFDGDPGAGWYAGNYNRNPDGTVAISPAAANTLALYVGSGNSGGAVFNAPHTRLSSLTVSGGTAVVSASLDPAKPNVLQVRDGLSVATGSRYLDLKNNALITYGGAATSYASLRNMVTNRYVRSSLADGGRTLGYARASEVAALNPSDGSYSWLGLPVNGSDLLVRYTLAGDANLDGTVDFNDLVRLAQNYNTTLPGADPAWWLHGDFTYDGVVDFNDLVKLAQNYNTGLDAAAVSGASAAFGADLARAVASVPEPCGMVGGGVVGIAALARRRRR